MKQYLRTFCVKMRRASTIGAHQDAMLLLSPPPTLLSLPAKGQMAQFTGALRTAQEALGRLHSRWLLHRSCQVQTQLGWLLQWDLLPPWLLIRRLASTARFPQLLHWWTRRMQAVLDTQHLGVHFFHPLHRLHLIVQALRDIRTILPRNLRAIHIATQK